MTKFYCNNITKFEIVYYKFKKFRSKLHRILCVIINIIHKFMTFI